MAELAAPRAVRPLADDVDDLLKPLPSATAAPAKADDGKPKSVFSPHSVEFRPKLGSSPSAYDFPSPAGSASSSEPGLDAGGALDQADDAAQWTLTADGQLVDRSGATYELADQIVRLQQPHVPLPPHAASALIPASVKPRPHSGGVAGARPWSPSPLRVEQQQAAAAHDAAQRRQPSIGQPDDSHPFSAFANWRQQGLNDVPSPPVQYRRARSGSQDSASSSVGSAPSAMHGHGPYGAPHASGYDSPRAAFANFEAVSSRRSSSCSSSPSLGSRSPPVSIIPPAGMTFNGGHFPHGRATEPVGPRLDQLPAYTSPPSPMPSPLVPGAASPGLAGIDNPLAALYALASQAAHTDIGQAVMRLAAMQVAGPAPALPGPSANNRKLGLYKTELCRSWQEKESCRYGSKCQFAHGLDELRTVDRRSKGARKTEVCRAWQSSGGTSCPYGKRCVFRHEMPTGVEASPEAKAALALPGANVNLINITQPPAPAPPQPSYVTSAAVDGTLGAYPPSQPVGSPPLGRHSRSSSESSPYTRFMADAPPGHASAGAAVGQPHAGGPLAGLGITFAPPPPSTHMSYDAAAAFPRSVKPGGLLADLHDDEPAPMPVPIARTQAQHPAATASSPFAAFSPLGVNFNPAPGARFA